MERMNILLILIAVCVVINLIVFAMYGIDKHKAIHDQWRIPEATLLLAAVFGPIGALIGMRVFHHKTKKPKFYITVPLILIAEMVALFFAARAYFSQTRTYDSATFDIEEYVSNVTLL